MAKLLTLPKLSVVMKEGKIINWYFNEGDKIKKGDVLYDVEAGKMGGSAESEDEGTILKILANVGDKLKCGEPVAIIGEPGESFEELIPVKAEETEEATEKNNCCRNRRRPRRICCGNKSGTARCRGNTYRKTAYRRYLS